MVEQMESLHGAGKQTLISWRSILAGVVIALFALAGLSGLGVAFGGIGLDENSSFQGALTFTGGWAIGSILLSIAAGSYFSARSSGRASGKVGSAHGMVVAALFLGLVMWQALSVLGWAGRTAGDAVGGAAVAIGKGTNALSQNNTVNEIAEDTFGDLKIQQDRLQAVATGVATRLYRGDVESAKSYLSRQTGISKVEAQQRIDQLKARADQAIASVREGAKDSLRSTGLTLFLAAVLGAIAGSLGGALGSRANRRQPLAAYEQVSVQIAGASL